MAEDKVINKENPVFSIEVSLRYEKNLQSALSYSFQNWGAVTMVNFYLQVVQEIDTLVFFPYSNPQNRFLDDINYREIILRNYPFVITYRINKNIVKIINIIHTSRHPALRRGRT